MCICLCVLVSTTESLWVTLYNVRPRGSVKCGHGLKLKSAAAGMPACWSGATFGAEPCSQSRDRQQGQPASQLSLTLAQDSVSPLVKTDISSKPDLQPFKLPVCFIRSACRMVISSFFVNQQGKTQRYLV